MQATDDERWLDQLARQAEFSEAKTQVLLEAEIIRSAIKVNNKSSEFELSNRNLNDLIDRATKENLLVRSTQSRDQKLRLKLYNFFSMPQVMFGVTSIACFLIIANIVQYTVLSEFLNPSLEVSQTLRSASGKVITQRSRDLKVEADEIKEALIERGVRFSMSYNLPQRIEIQIRMDANIQKFLKGRNIDAPDTGQIYLVLSPSR